ncbi:MAG: hypothetical protein Q8R57_00015 [Bacteroidota bacterium]|nr:hypothetical protein [Bacteroidota bacterium]
MGANAWRNLSKAMFRTNIDGGIFFQTKRFFSPLRCAQYGNVFWFKGVFDIGSFAANINHALKMRECRSFRPQGGTSFFLAESIVLKQIFL